MNKISYISAAGYGQAVPPNDAILTDSHLDARVKRYIMMNLIVPKLEYAGEVWEENAKLVKKLKTGQMTAARKIPGCSRTRSNIAVLGIRMGLSAPTADRP